MDGSDSINIVGIVVTVISIVVGIVGIVVPIYLRRKAKVDTTFLGNLPIRNALFTGRADLLHGIESALGNPGGTILTQTLVGLGGIGKTQTAIEYAYRRRKQYEHVFMLLAESPDSLVSSWGDVAERLNLLPGAGPLKRALATRDYFAIAASGSLSWTTPMMDPKVCQ